MILTQEQHFENAINHNPADLETRCAYIDWMYEQGRVEEADKWLAILHKVPLNTGWYVVYPKDYEYAKEYEIDFYSYDFHQSILDSKLTLYGHLKALVNEVIRLNIEEVK